jgi:membrane protease YdiL (CAAX protease family)
MKKLGIPPQVLAAGVRVGVFAFFSLAGLMLFAWLFLGLGYFVASALHAFAAAAVANLLCMRIFEHASLADIGLHWNRASVIHLLLGLAGGALAGLFVTLGPVLEGSAELLPIAGQSADWRNIAMLLILILFGGAGEEMLFHGYGFQILLGLMGPFATILPVSVLFAVAHAQNLNVHVLGLINTGLWGLVLGTAFLKSGDLWLPVGLHVGWNWALPLMGARLSGFTMSVTGYELRWKTGPLWSGGGYGPEGGLLTTLVLVVLFLWLIWKAPVRTQTPYLLRERWEEM